MVPARVLAVAVGVVVPGALLLAGASAKAYQPTALSGVWAWLGVPVWAERTAVLGVVMVEALVGGSLIVFPASRRPKIAAIVLFCVFSLVLAFMLASETPPSCGCFGLTRMFEHRRGELAAGLGRNLLLVAGLM